MNNIIHLPQDIINKIAAGEVIERPSFAVKELVENAIDAGATNIEIHIEEAGLRKIQVIDNGRGMSRKDAEISFLPHTTSKLTSEESLHSIKTLGFRGEALSSIASVAKMTIVSRAKDAVAGTVVSLDHGAVQNISAIGTAVGTVVTVEDLFDNVPGRLKFLKSDKTEFRHITEIVTNYALSFPHIHFVLTHNSKIIFDLPHDERLDQRMKMLLGADFFAQLIPLSFVEGFVRIQGLLGKPQIAGKQNQKQFLFVNNRSVTDRLSALAVKEAYGTLLPQMSTPVFLLHLTLPHELVDVNVHPRKEQIAFVNNKLVFDSIRLAVTQALSEHNLTFNLAKFKEETSVRSAETTSFAGQFLKKAVLSDLELTKSNRSKTVQIADTYLVTQTENSLLLIDQHAAHERILFEQLTTAFGQEKKKQQTYKLTKPHAISLSVTDAQVLEEYLSVFEKLGFHFLKQTTTEVMISHAPRVFKGRKLEKIMKDMLIDLSDRGEVQSVDGATQRMLSFLACRAAVKAGDALPHQEITQILTSLQQVDNNATCPHGRPTTISLTHSELDKLFHRR